MVRKAAHKDTHHPAGQVYVSTDGMAHADYLTCFDCKRPHPTGACVCVACEEARLARLLPSFAERNHAEWKAVEARQGAGSGLDGVGLVPKD